MFNKAILIIGFVLIGASLGVSSNERHKPIEEQWEHRCYGDRAFSEVQTQMVRRGLQGYELVTLLHTDKIGFFACFKRKMTD